MTSRKRERKEALYFHKKSKKKHIVHLTILLVTFYTKAENVVGRVHEEIKLRLENA